MSSRSFGWQFAIGAWALKVREQHTTGDNDVADFACIEARLDVDWTVGSMIR